ncbi:rhodanese-like domain-containing protein [Clostridium sp. JN-9]|uniref:rhodanese-like domain-containing protein n=1 Tax=Clostridium sp. JN-9 TaxID=2507159 RepID=UPI000FFE0900|nr:rhodanese-like domain-containing protein [Clostridium sp. JN-9]QAT39016.1 rhodanese-like domain-containing protein [Clostridium sp. JN-9]
MFSKNSNNFKLYFYLIAVSLIVVTLFFPYESVKAYKKITAIEVKDMINTPSSEALIIDVRTPSEYKQGHIPKSINIPLQILKDEVIHKNINKSTKIIVYCQRGIRSENAAEILEQLGYNNVYSLGGIDQWTYDIEKD